MYEMSAPLSLTSSSSDRSSGSNRWLHLVTLASITIVAVTATIMLNQELSFDQVTAIAIGCCIFLVGSGCHLVVSKRTRNFAASATLRRSSANKKQPAAPASASNEPDTVQITEAASIAPARDPGSEILSSSMAAIADANGADGSAEATVQVDDPVDPSHWTNELAVGLANSDAMLAAPLDQVHGAKQHFETEFERVERLVKRLADNVNQLEADRTRPTTGGPLATGAARSIQNSESVQYSLFTDANDSEQQLSNSIHALRSTAGLGPTAPWPPLTPADTGFAPKPQTPPPINRAHNAPHLAAPWSPPAIDDRVPPQPNIQTGSELTAILNALAALRIAVALEPILDLSVQRPTHYEVSIALRDQDAEPINLANVAADLSGTGVLPLIDSARLVQAAQMARRLADKGRQGSVLAELNAESLGDAYFETTSRNHVGAFAGQIVLTLPQAQAHGFTSADWATLARLRASGLAFALADVTTLDADFAALANAGFIFAKMDARTFFSGLPIGTEVVPSTDICHHLAQEGLMVIVQGITASDELVQVQACGVHLGQGQVFGGARQMKTSGAAPAQVVPAQVAAE